MYEDGDSEVTTTLQPGSIFGEVGLLVALSSQVTLQAKSHVDLLCLSHSDLYDVLTYYPIIEATIQRRAKECFGELLNASEIKCSSVNLEKQKQKLFNK